MGSEQLRYSMATGQKTVSLVGFGWSPRAAAQVLFAVGAPDWATSCATSRSTKVVWVFFLGERLEAGEKKWVAPKVGMCGVLLHRSSSIIPAAMAFLGVKIAVVSIWQFQSHFRWRSLPMPEANNKGTM